MSETQEGGLLPIVLLVAVGAIAFFAMMQRLGLSSMFSAPATQQKRTAEMRQQMQEIKALRVAKEEFLKAEGEAASQGERSD